MPNAQPVYRSLSMPAASSTAGCTMPLPRISIHPVPLHVAHPEPPQTPHWASSSAEGSVNGKKLGRKRVRAGAEEAAREVGQGRLEVHEADPFVDGEPFDLREHRRVRRIEEVATVDVPRREDANGRRPALHRSHLHRRRVRAQERPRTEVQRIVCVHGGMVRREVQRAEVVPLGFGLRA